MTVQIPTPTILNRGLVVSLAVLMVTAAGCGSSGAEPTTTAAPATTAAAATTTTAASAMPEIEQLLDEYNRIWSAADADAFKALLTDDYVHSGNTFLAGADLSNPEQVSLSSRPGGGHDLDQTINRMMTYGSIYQIERIGEPIVSGDGPWFVSVAEDSAQGDAHCNGISTFVIVEEAGTLKVAYHFGACLETYEWATSG